MKKINRRAFIQSSSLANGRVAYANHSFCIPKKIPPIYLSQHLAVKWSFPEVLDFATKHGYTGIESEVLQAN